MSQQLVLLIDDDQELGALLQEWLRPEGFNLDLAYTASSAINYLACQQANHNLPAALVVDVMLPDGNGLDLLRNLRRDYANLPVLMLSARGEPYDKILGLELGADDYLAKPCDPRELTARLRAILRRSIEQPSLKVNATSQQAYPAQQPATNLAQNLIFEDLNYNPASGTLLLAQQVINLTPTEGKILEALLAHPGQLVDKQQLAQQALGRQLTLYDRSLDMHISNLRRKLGQHTTGTARILSLRGRGYYYVSSNN